MIFCPGKVDIVGVVLFGLIGCALKGVLSLVLVSVYVTFVVVLFYSSHVKSFSHALAVVLVGGWAPLFGWLVVILLSKPKAVLKMSLMALGLTAYHYIVAAVAAHALGVFYWVVQLIEIAMLLLLICFVKRGQGRDFSASA